MKKFFKAATVIAAAALVLTCSCTLGSGLKTYGENFYAMGTVGTLITALPDNAKAEREFDAFTDEVRSLLTSADNSLSATLTSSYIYAFNQAEAGSVTPIDKTAYDVLSRAKEIYTLTQGYYNPAVYYNVKEYGFPLDKDEGAPTTLPDENRVQEFCSLASHFGEVEIFEKDGKYYAQKPDYTVTVDGSVYTLALDLGGIGKGWCANKVGQLMQEKGYNYGMFNFSSSSLALKSYAFNDSGNYSLEPRDPRAVQDISSFCAIDIKDCNLSTSGDYEKYYEIDGTRYCHIINPFTGSPIQTGIASVTVIGGSATEDDAFTTALACMGKEKAVEFINGHLSDKFVVMLVFEDGVGKIITNRPQDITITNTQYKIANSVENGRIVLDVA